LKLGQISQRQKKLRRMRLPSPAHEVHLLLCCYWVISAYYFGNNCPFETDKNQTVGL
jgi:hypothetical protein